MYPFLDSGGQKRKSKGSLGGQLMSTFAEKVDELAKYADGSLDSIMKAMLAELFAHMPEKPVDFMIAFLKSYKEKDQKMLQEEVQRQRLLKQPGTREGRKTFVLPTMPIEEEAEGDDMPARARRGRRRVGVSAETVDIKTLEKAPHRVVEKSESDRMQILAAVKNNFLFASLDDEQMNIVSSSDFLLLFVGVFFVLDRK